MVLICISPLIMHNMHVLIITLHYYTYLYTKNGLGHWSYLGLPQVRPVGLLARHYGICKICFNIYHISCLNDNIKSTKQWSCNAC